MAYLQFQSGLGFSGLQLAREGLHLGFLFPCRNQRLLHAIKVGVELDLQEAVTAVYIYYHIYIFRSLGCVDFKISTVGGPLVCFGDIDFIISTAERQILLD